MQAYEIYEEIVAAGLDAWVAKNDPYGELTLLEQIDGYYADYAKNTALSGPEHLLGARTQMEKHVESMIEKAAKADKSDDALKFSQAACNAANAMCALKSEKTIK